MNYKFVFLIYLLISKFINGENTNDDIKNIKQNNRVFINSWVKFDKKNKILPNNWGDDINFHFLNEIFDVDFVYNSYKGEVQNYSLIGSVISNGFLYNNTIIWGSGTQDDRATKLKVKPKKVLAVRGPLTRKYLINQNIECPEIYGDPAVLLPHFYNPKIKIKYEIGFIPHWQSLKNKAIEQFCSDKRIHLIKLKGYKHWMDVIDEILACKYIVSESLHGLIISESYGKPNLWCKITLNKYNIKFHDWFLSIGIDREKPYIIKNNTTVNDIITEMKNYKRGKPIDINKLISASPFKLKKMRDIKFKRKDNFKIYKENI